MRYRHLLLSLVITCSLLVCSCAWAQTVKDDAGRLAKKIAEKKRVQEQERKMLVEGHTVKGIVLYKDGEYAQALEEFMLAQSLDPYNKEVSKYIDRCKEEIEKQANKCFLRGVKYYTKGELLEAADEFSLVPEVSTKYNEAQDYLTKIEQELKTSTISGAALPEAKTSKITRKEARAQKKDIKQQIRDIETELSVVQLAKEAQEKSMMLEVEKAYLPPEKPEREEEVEVETEEERKEREEAEARAKVVDRLKSINVPALSLTDADIRDVIRQLMNMTGITIVLDESALTKVAAEGTVRVTFTTVNPIPLLDLLELALKATNLGYRVEPTYIWVSDKETLAKEELVTKTYKLKYGVRKIREVSLSELGASESKYEEEY